MASFTLTEPKQTRTSDVFTPKKFYPFQIRHFLCGQKQRHIVHLHRIQDQLLEVSERLTRQDVLILVSRRLQFDE